MQTTAFVVGGVSADGDIGEGEAGGAVVIVNAAAIAVTFVGPIAADGDAVENCHLFVVNTAAFVVVSSPLFDITTSVRVIVENAAAVVARLSLMVTRLRFAVSVL